jgi:DNA-binding transcriptional LysR family regulator
MPARRSGCEVDAILDLVRLVALAVGVALLPPGAIALAGGRAAGIACDPPIPRELLLVTPADRELSPAGAAFAGMLEGEAGGSQ